MYFSLYNLSLLIYLIIWTSNPINAGSIPSEFDLNFVILLQGVE